MNQKFATLRPLGLSIVSVEALNKNEDVVDGVDPFEWVVIVTVMTDEVNDVDAQSLGGLIDGGFNRSSQHSAKHVAKRTCTGRLRSKADERS